MYRASASNQVMVLIRTDPLDTNMLRGIRAAWIERVIKFMETTNDFSFFRLVSVATLTT